MFSATSFEEAYLNSHKINELESLYVDMYHYRIGIIFLLTLVVLDYFSQQCIMNEDNQGAKLSNHGNH